MLRVLVCVALVTACGSGGTQPLNLRFGQTGQIRVNVVTPVEVVSPSGAGDGEVQQVLTWGSNGAWQLFESLSYRDLVGDESLTRSPGTPVAFASAYASLITQLNESEALQFIATLDQEIDPDCDPPQSRVTVLIRDDTRDEERRWIRCARGPLESLDPAQSGPDTDASRVIVAAQLARDFTMGSSFSGTYSGSVPFGTLEKGEGSGAELDTPIVFRVESGPADAPEGWEVFWVAHTESQDPPPSIDWSSDMVVVGAAGVRFEAGDSVEVRRILQVNNGTLVEIFERVPGDFCSPAARTQTPFHIVLAPKTTPVVRFSDLRRERVPCGF